MKSKFRVLIVEDCSLTAEQLAETIQTWVPTATITIEESEDAAIASARSRTPHLVILDLNLKKGTGFNVLRKFKATDPPPIVVVMTNFGLPQYRELAFLMGTDYFLDKAAGTETLESIVRSMVQTKPSPSPPRSRSTMEVEKPESILPPESGRRLH